MIRNKLAESLIWVVIWVFILSFIILWITNLLVNSISTIGVYENKRDIQILRNNTINIVKNIDTSSVSENELFYLYKDKNNDIFEVKTWVWNADFKYIDRFWDKVDDLENFNWNIYSRVLWMERSDSSLWNENQIIKASIKRLVKSE